MGKHFQHGAMRCGHGLLLVAALAISGCAYFPRAAPRPIPAVFSTGKMPAASTLVVFLPGRIDQMDVFERHGWPAEMERAGIRADWVAVDTHLGYFLNRTVVDALSEDILRPARARGYRRIVLVGVSLGGLGALLFERDRAGLADGLVLIAPYLGDSDRLFAEIRDEGGPAAWAAVRERTDDDIAVQLWTFLGERSATLPPIWLVWGQKDGLAGGHRLLAPLLPAARVRTNDGGHKWTAWTELWRSLCAESDLFTAEKVSLPSVRAAGR